jgi:nucleoside-diphosphate-sugar epimerase
LAYKRTIVVTGATGNMGKGAIERLAQEPDAKICVFIRPQEAESPLVRRWVKDHGVAVALGDLTDARSVNLAVEGADVVLHLGGLVSPLADELPPELVSQVNVEGTRNVVEAIKASPRRDAIRLVYIGTVAETGDRSPPIHWGRTGDPIKVGRHGHYAVTKAQGEAVVAESGLRYWVSLRQSGMAHYDMWKTSGPIVFHNPINGVFEWSTANDSARLLAGVTRPSVPDEFWRNFYNIGGGASSRVVNHEFMAKSMAALGIGDFRKVMRPNWSATRNFHGQWYADSDRLEALVPFREQSLDAFFEELPRHVPATVRLFSRLFPGVIHNQLKKVAKAPGGSLHWIEHNEEEEIRAYFGSRAAWEQIPANWDDFHFAQPSREPTLLDHGYDERKPKEAWTCEDLAQAAAFRGGKCGCSAPGPVDPYAPVEWECALGHRFTMTPNLYLQGGHWCPTCQVDIASYDSVARLNPFFAQVWRQDLDEAASAPGGT